MKINSKIDLQLPAIKIFPKSIKPNLKFLWELSEKKISYFFVQNWIWKTLKLMSFKGGMARHGTHTIFNTLLA